MTDPAGKSTLITGAGGGFGGHMVRQFGSAGARLILTDVDEAALEEAKAAAGSNLLGAIAADLATDAGCDAVADLCSSLGGAPDVLVNNAGVGFAGRIDHVPRDRWEMLMQLNLLAPMRLCNRFVPEMVERGSGHIINISSLAGWVGSHGMSAYCASKFAVLGFTESLAREEAAQRPEEQTATLDEQALGLARARQTLTQPVTLVILAVGTAGAKEPWEKIKIPELNSVEMPEYERVELPNGMVLYLAEDHYLPMIELSAQIMAGDIYDPADKVGLASMTGSVMRTGGSTTTGTELKVGTVGGTSTGTSLGFATSRYSVIHVGR